MLFESPIQKKVGDIIKCRYKYCKNNNEVEKEVATKVGNSYFCPECYKEKEDKNLIVKKIYVVLPNEIKININKSIVDWINKKEYSTDYVLYVLDHIKDKKCSINSVYGVAYYLNSFSIKADYDSHKSFEEYKTVVKNDFAVDNSETSFSYGNKNGEDWCKIL